MAPPNAEHSCPIVAGAGAVPLYAPEYESSLMALVMSATRSSRWIQLTHCWPVPKGPPAKSSKMGSLCGFFYCWRFGFAMGGGVLVVGFCLVVFAPGCVLPF
jgi:hypothetical protein